MAKYNLSKAREFITGFESNRTEKRSRLKHKTFANRKVANLNVIHQWEAETRPY